MMPLRLNYESSIFNAINMNWFYNFDFSYNHSSQRAMEGLKSSDSVNLTEFLFWIQSGQFIDEYIKYFQGWVQIQTQSVRRTSSILLLFSALGYLYQTMMNYKNFNYHWHHIPLVQFFSAILWLQHPSLTTEELKSSLRRFQFD